MKYIILLISLIFMTNALARVKHLSYEEQIEYMQSLRAEQSRLIASYNKEADNVFMAFVLWKNSTTKMIEDKQYHVHEYEFKKVTSIKGTNPPLAYTFKDPADREIVITSGGPRIELNNKYLNHERFFIIYMKGDELLRATEFIDYDGLLNSKEELSLVKKKVNK